MSAYVRQKTSMGRYVKQVLTSVRKRKKIWSLERTGCDATRSKKFSRPTLRRSTKSGSRLSADSLCHTNSAYKGHKKKTTKKNWVWPKNTQIYTIYWKSKLRKIKTTDEIVSSTQQINHMHLILLYFSFHLMCHSPFSLVVEGWWCRGRWPGGMFWAAQIHCSVSTKCQVQQA